MSITPLDLAAKRPCEQKKPSRKPFRTETRVEPKVVKAADGHVMGRFELGDVRRRAVLQRDLDDALRRRALHLRTGNMAAYRAADRQADHFLDLIAAGIPHRWEH